MWGLVVNRNSNTSEGQASLFAPHAEEIEAALCMCVCVSLRGYFKSSVTD